MFTSTLVSPSGAAYEAAYLHAIGVLPSIRSRATGETRYLVCALPPKDFAALSAPEKLLLCALNCAAQHAAGVKVPMLGEGDSARVAATSDAAWNASCRRARAMLPLLAPLAVAIHERAEASGRLSVAELDAACADALIGRPVPPRERDDRALLARKALRLELSSIA